jgi:hypothetical protein
MKPYVEKRADAGVAKDFSKNGDFPHRRHVRFDGLVGLVRLVKCSNGQVMARWSVAKRRRSTAMSTVCTPCDSQTNDTTAASASCRTTHRRTAPWALRRWSLVASHCDGDSPCSNASPVAVVFDTSPPCGTPTVHPIEAPVPSNNLHSKHRWL